MSFRRLAVYCGSSARADAAYYEAARGLGHYLADHGIGLVYGGGRVGMMGAVADAALERGGEVIGVITEKLNNLELGHDGCTELLVVEGMHPRKQLMTALSDGFIAMPGGYGTFEELFEAVTWSQLNIHHKPVGLLNVRGYYDALIAMIDHAHAEHFVRPSHRGLVVHAEGHEELLARMAGVSVPDLERWMHEEF